VAHGISPASAFAADAGTIMKNPTRLSKLAGVALSLLAFASVRADAPNVFAITGARIVTAAGPVIDAGTVVIRSGAIDAVGASIPAPADARVIDGKGLTVYPGLIDMGNTSGLDVPTETAPQNARTTMELERWKRRQILRPQLEAAGHLRPDAAELSRLAAAGITSVLETPPGEVVKGQSALVNVAAPPDAPQIGQVADERRGSIVVKTPVALHVAFPNSPRGSGYPESLMGVIAFVRQAFLDASHYAVEQSHYDKTRRASERPGYDEALEALQPALARRMPVAFDADLARQIRRALAVAREFKLDPVITGAQEADQVADELKAQSARVLFSLNFPARPRTLAPDADEPMRDLRLRADLPKVPAALSKAGVTYAFASDGLREPKDFIRNAARAVKAGLPADAAIRALTINAATIAGVSDRLGSIEKNKIANLVVTDGDLFDEKTKIRHVFIDGRLVRLEEGTSAPERRGRGGQP
jgi:imidazolonepropionase-like amidohydrolase